jgi:FAD/FMN-containing dehydrogenase
MSKFSSIGILSLFVASISFSHYYWYMTFAKTSINPFSGAIVTSEDEEYDTARAAYMATGTPKAILYPRTTDDIAVALHYVTANHLPLSIRSGGHSGMGHSTNDDGVIIDMKNFSDVIILDESKGIVRVGSGAHWGDVARKLTPKGLVVSAGDTKSVGVGGLTLGGGIGIMARKYGLAVDQLIGAEVVAADGRTLTVNKSENADLFWALRGGGGNFGVVTHLDFAAHRLGNVFFGIVAYQLDDLKQVLTGWRDATRKSPREVTTTLVIMPGFGGNPSSAQLLYCFAGEDEAANNDALAPFLEVAPIVSQSVTRTPYADALQEAHPPVGVIPSVKDGLIKSMDDTIVDILTTIYTGATDKMMFLRSLGGAIQDTDAHETAFTHRDAEALLVCAAFLPSDAPNEAKQTSMHFFDEKIAPLLEGAYSNFFSMYNEADFARMYPAETLARLRAIKAIYDPDNIFSRNYNITP